jgi:AraC family transcriptional regulator
VGDPHGALCGEWSSLRLEEVSTPPGGLVEYRPTSDLVSVATGSRRAIEVVIGNAPPQHVDVVPGQVHIIPANVAVGVRLFGPAENILVTLNHRLVSEIGASQGALHVELRTAFGLEDVLIQQLVYAIQEEATSASTDSQYVQALGAALAAHLVRRYASDSPDRSARRCRMVRPSLGAVLEYIDQNLDGRLTLPRLAEVARLSVFAFVRSFKTSTGVPPHRYILRRRVERAKLLLSDAALNIAEVALRCGFGDQSAFTTTFRRLTSQTPRAYRDRFREQRKAPRPLEGRAQAEAEMITSSPGRATDGPLSAPRRSPPA